MDVPRTVEGAPSPQSAILGFLMRGPRHPYGLYREFDGELGRVWRVGRSHLYAHLGRLEADGLVAARIEPQGTRPARKVYRITPMGRKAFRKWARTPSRHVRHIRLELLARLYFHRRLGLPDLPGFVEGQREILESRRESLRAAIREEGDSFWRTVLEFRIAETEAVVDWLDRCFPKKEGGCP